MPLQVAGVFPSISQAIEAPLNKGAVRAVVERIGGIRHPTAGENVAFFFWDREAGEKGPSEKVEIECTGEGEEKSRQEEGTSNGDKRGGSGGERDPFAMGEGGDGEGVPRAVEARRPVG